VRMSSAAAAMVIPAICAMVREIFPDIVTPFGPTLAEAWLIAVLDEGLDVDVVVVAVEFALLLELDVGVGV